MKKLSSVIFIAFIAIAPLRVFAHASPLEYIPQSSAQEMNAPTEIRIRFSERPEPGASRIVVKDAAGKEVQKGNARVNATDARELFVPVEANTDGAYFVTWSVISADDGHFSKGGYAYFVGAGGAGETAPAPQVEVVQLSAIPEATAMFVELLGNSLLWGALLVLVFVLRRRMKEQGEEVQTLIARGFGWFVFTGVLLILLGAGAHMALKTFELATLNSIRPQEALVLYLATTAGWATGARAVCALLFGILFLLRRKAVVTAEKITLSVILLFVVLGVFAYLRARVSHALANPFFPEFSVLVNFFHLIGKDGWAGITAVLSVAYCVKRLRSVIVASLSRAFSVIAVLFGVVGISAAYVVWLHLKDFSNLSSTLWGERFIPLLVVALLAVALLSYHVLAPRFLGRLVNRLLPYTLPAEFALGVLIVFFSSLMIITSPPLEAPAGNVFTAKSNGVMVSLSRAPYEDGMALLTLTPEQGEIKTPVLTLDGGAEGGILVKTEQRFRGGYAFPLALLPGNSEHHLTVIASQSKGYDANAKFTVSESELAPKASSGGHRTFDAFALIMSVLGALALLYAVFLFLVSRKETWESAAYATPLRTVTGFLVALLVASQAIGLTHLMFSNRFQAECLADGNGWHLMLPARNGKPVSQVPAEGCMALGGSFHIVDPREYEFLKAPQPSHIEFSNDLQHLKAGVPTTLSFSIKNEDGTAPLLSVQHERLIHVIVISADMKHFSHVHPDDASALSPEDVKNAAFSIPYTFPASGRYIIGIDYASGLSAREEKFIVEVQGAPALREAPVEYPSKGTFDGYDVSFNPGLPVAGKPALLSYRVTKDGKDVLDLEPYLAAAMHIAVVKNDLSEFMHVHGEVHPLGAPVTPVASTTAHNHLPPPRHFGPLIEAHALFPTPGLYTVFGQMMREGKIILSTFTVQVE